MPITWNDFDKIWAVSSPLTPYTFSDLNYAAGWNFIGATPPARQMWDSLQRANDEKFKFLRDNFGTPNMVTTAAQMTDTDKIYVYVGSEAGWNNGHWYYYDADTSAWVDGGVYNSTAFVTDTTLTEAGKAADAKAVGDALALKADLAGATFTGNVAVNADFSTTGDATVASDLTVSGATNLTGNVTAGADITATGDITANDASFANATLSGTLSVTGATTLDGLTAGSMSAQSLNTTGNASIGGTLTVSGATTLADVTASDINADDITANTLTVFGVSTLTGNITAGADVTVTGDLSVTNITASGDITADDVTANGNLSVVGNATLSGTSTAVTPAAEDNSTKIATTQYVQTEIKPIEVNADIVNKRVTNIEKLLQGNLYDYQTDTDSKYVKSVPSGAMPYASLDSMGGRTVVMNQFIQNGDFSADAGWTYSTGTTHTITDGVATIVGAVDNYFEVSLATARALNIWAGHKYLISAVVSNDIGRVVLVPTGATSGGYETFNDVSTPTRIFYLYTPASDGSVRMYCRFHNATVGTEQTVTGTISNYMCIDLTLMFGSGNEPTIDEFKAMFPAQYYQYSQGSLLSAGVTEVVSKKADTTTIATYPIPAEVQALDGYGWSAENVYNYVDYERKVFVKNIGKIDLGSLDYNYYSNANAFYAPSPDDSRGRKSGGIACVCARYKTMHYASFAGMATVSVAIEMNPNASSVKRIYIRDDSFDTDAEGRAALKESLQGVYLYYELGEPVEIDISAYLTDDNLIEVEAGGTLTFPNQHGDDYQIPVPSSETYMVDLQASLGG